MFVSLPLVCSQPVMGAEQGGVLQRSVTLDPTVVEKYELAVVEANVLEALFGWLMRGLLKPQPQ